MNNKRCDKLDQLLKGRVGPICPYCGGQSHLKPDSFVYGGRSYGGNVFICENYPRCDAFCGSHKDGRPLGTLANKSLREWRMAAHDAFDPLWKTRLFVRKVAYQLLAGLMDIPVADCHIGHFDENQCKQVIEHCVTLREMANRHNYKAVKARIPK